MWAEHVRTSHEYAASHSEDPDTRVGALLLRPDGALLSSACNAMPRGVKRLSTRWERPEKYRFVEHAERNAIYECARLGVSTQGSTAVLTLFCCTECARGMIQAGVVRVVTPRPNLQCMRWGTDWINARDILEEAGVEVEWVEAS